MKKLYIILFFGINIFCFSQTSTQSGVTQNYQKAQFPGGDEGFIDEFLKMIHAYIDLRHYAVNGKFTFIFDVDEKGKISDLDVVPKVKNSEMFIDDMNFAIKKVKKKWQPALKDGQPISSKKIISINFTSDHTDG